MAKPEQQPWERGIMIPACDELEQLPQAIQSLSKLPFRKILVVVLNQTAEAPLSISNSNKQLRELLLQWPNQQISSRSHQINHPSKMLDIALISRIEDPLHPKEGVGIARHIGMQYLCDLVEKGALSSPFIYSTDADARFPQDHLDPLPQTKQTHLHSYLHTPAQAPLIIYEMGLRYYSLGLHDAGAPCPFPTIGSVITTHADLYRKSSGFPNRQAGEDFYLLNKLAKLGPVHYLGRDPVQLVDRPSDRVPFGTGKGRADIEAAQLEYDLYHPEVFKLLRAWYQALKELPDKELIDELNLIAPNFPGTKKIEKAIKQPVREARWLRRRFECFDLFWTMKWIHHIRDTQFPSIPYREALRLAPFVPQLDGNLEHQQKMLFYHERQTLTARSYALP